MMATLSLRRMLDLLSIRFEAAILQPPRKI
jgi:hypothetical protein